MSESTVKEIEEKNLAVHGIEIFRGGEVIFRHDFSAERRFPIYSATKAFTSAAVGIAVREGHISDESYLYEFLDRKHINCIPSAQLDNFKRMTFRRFMTMSVDGYPFRPSGDDWLQYALSLPVDYGKPPSFSYSNIPAMLVAAACENAVGEHLISYLTPRLFEPLGIEKPVYANCPQGGFYGASGMELSVHELSLLGQLYLQNGVFGGERILSEEWVRKSTSEQISSGGEGYGYFIWCSKNSFAISGKWGQKCLVYPEKGLMITYLSNLPERSGEMLDIAERISNEI